MLQPCKTTSKIIVLCILIFIFRQKTGIEKCVEQLIADLDDWLTVHRSITLVNFQLDAQNSYLFIYTIHLLQSSTCFEHCSAHLQEVYVVIVYM